MLKQLCNFGAYEWNPFALPVFLVSVCILSVGIFVFRQNVRSKINASFFYECASIFLWLFTISFVYFSKNPWVANLWYRYFTFFGVLNIMPSLIVFAYSWLGELKKHRALVLANFIPVLAFYLWSVHSDFLIGMRMHRYFWGMYPVYHAGAVLFLVHFGLQAFLGYGALFRAYRAETNLTRKKQIGLIGIANVIGFTAAADFLPKFFHVPLYPYGYVSLLVFIALVGYSIVRYRAFDIETVIHKTVMWIGTSLLVLIPLVGVYAWMFPFLKDFLYLQVAFLLGALFLFAFYLRIVQPRIDRLFQRHKANLEQIATRFSENLVHLRGVVPVLSRIKDTIREGVNATRTDIYLWDEDRKRYVDSDDFTHILRFSGDTRFFSWLAETNRTLYREFTDIDPFSARLRDEAKECFHASGATVLLPLVVNEKLLGCIALGKKENLRRYSAADFSFLNMLKNQSAIALSNSLLYENIEKQVREKTRELVDVQKQLIQAEKLATVGTLAGGVAHEINNPLTAVLTNVQMLLAAPEGMNETDLESLQLIEEATKRCRNIVQKLMTYAKKPMESGTWSMVDLSSAVDRVMAFVGYQLQQENINLRVQVVPGTYPVNGNQNEIEQVLTNLILNARDAIKSARRKGNIEIRLSRENDASCISVRDEGPGIKPALISKIFDPFFTTKDVGKGLGLGLSICQSIVEQHRGRIEVSSRPGQGTEFRVFFPIHTEKGLIPEK
ncbi:MAG: hypothetical protein GF333_05615 [Candidatus Omnitrophica bacterium]|nr:hypothetical protein [Candidatus Omnitrophota bacterium]